MKKGYLKKCSTRKKKKRKISKFVDAGGYNRNDKEGNVTTWNGSTEKDGEE